ncbi:MAG: 2,3,4,5-tetrahydropyridine-2,6-dicarboxylate N-succinyltransferase, partial [Beijerinckiaceae bacterium]
MSAQSLAAIIDKAWDNRADVSSATKGEVRDAVNEALALLDAGKMRVAEKVPGTTGKDSWVVHQWLKKAVLLSFRLNDNSVIGFSEPSGQPLPYGYDKVPLKWADWGDNRFRDAGFRVVPGAVVRHSAFIAKNVGLRPSFVNVGANVGEATMVDTWATVGSCAQIGKNVHLSGGV